MIRKENGLEDLISLKDTVKVSFLLAVRRLPLVQMKRHRNRVH